MRIELLGLLLAIVELLFWGIVFFKGKQMLKKVNEK